MTMRAWLRSRRGATPVEYMVMLILTALVVLAAVKVFGGTVKSKYSRANDDLGGTLAAEDQQGRGGEGGGDSLGPTARYGVEASGSQGGDNAKGAGSGSDKSRAGNRASGEGSSSDSKAGSGSGSGSGEDNGDGRIGGGEDDGAENRGAAERPEAGKSEGKKSSVNPIVILVALLLLGLLLYVMASGKEG